ncbi:MAG: Flp1 family type IVb pilin [Hespellia sp.]|nr:Flp1 family type IVb pilin [Hespellia sp.]
MEITCLCKIDKGKKRIAESVKAFVQDTSGIGVVELILILVVLIALVVIFKSQLTALVNSIFEKITSESSGI